MKNPSISVAVTALIAFSLGYLVRGDVEQVPGVINDSEKTTVPQSLEISANQEPTTQAQTIESADSSDQYSRVTFDHAALVSSTHTTPRAAYVKQKRDRLEDFFLINGIGPDRAEQIIQDLIDADHYLSQKGNAIAERRSAEKAGLIPQDKVEGPRETAAKKAELRAERETLYRRIFGEFYEAHEEYRRSYIQRLVVKNFSSGLQQPLDYAAKEAVVQIMHEEQQRSVPESNPEIEAAGPGVDLADAPQGWEADKEKINERIQAKRQFNERVLERARAYMTASQFERFKAILDKDIRRIELMIELEELDEGL